MENRHSFQKNNRFQQPRTKQVSVDLFLFSCLEQERLNRRKDIQADPNSGRWPALKDLKVGNLPTEFAGAPLKALIDRVCIWYASQFPDLTDDRPFDSHQMNAVVEPFLNLTLDLADIILLKTGTIIPFSDSADPKAKEIWHDISNAVRDMFHTYESFFNKFLTWTFAEGAEEIAEPGSVQPVGRYSPYFKGPQAPPAPPQQPKQGKDSRGDTRGETRSDSRNDGRSDGRNDNRGDTRSDTRDMPHVKKAAPQMDDRQQKHNPADEETERHAIAEVDVALQQLKDDTGIEEVFLAPMNSFYRRIQHQYAVDQGYNSCSVGDGQERGVKVSRKS